MSTTSTIKRSRTFNSKGQKKIFITGGTGFLGSWIVRLLKNGGYHVFVLKRRGSDIHRLDGLLKSRFLTLVDTSDNIQALFKNEGVNIIIHTATSYGRNGETYSEVSKTNIKLPLKILEFATANSSELFINTDTFFKLSGNSGQKDLNYIKTKDKFLKTAKKRFENKIKFANLKLEHVYGPDDNPKKFIPFLINELSQGKTIDFNRGEQQRDFIYVEDAADAFIHTINNFAKLDPWEEFDIGTGETHTIKEFARKIQKTIKKPGIINWGARPYATGENMYSKADLSNNKKINWSYKYSFDKGIQKTVKSYLKPHEKR